MEIINIKGVDCYEQDGTAYLNLENVARGLGFTDNSKGDTPYVKWDRVRKYLHEIGFLQEVAKDGYIPENVFYRLAMKAKGAAARDFAEKIRLEVIPSLKNKINPSDKLSIMEETMEITVFENEQFGDIRIVMDGDKPLFCGKDVAEALGYKRTADAISAHCKGVCEMPTPTSGGMQMMKYVTEGDLYRLIFHSQLPTAQEFESWVMDDVLPSLRKHGTYTVGQMSPTQILRLQLEAMERIEMKQNQQNEVLCMQSRRLHDVAHKVDTMGELLTLNPEEWRGDSRKVVAKIAKKMGGFENIEDVYLQIYKVMLDRFGVDVNRRLKAKKRRAEKAGIAKSTIDGWSRLDAVAEDKRAIEAYLQVIREMAIKFGVDLEDGKLEKQN